ncbi:MAG: 4Fe-4S dicluster domain-containing protein [Nitrospirae bacterium]|nr:4Fe-4S dicluster domain-containing protein [Nitrospirota bacterium]
MESFRKLGEDLTLGAITIDPETCSGCKLCVAACAAKAIEMVGKKAEVVKDWPFCMSCGDCVAVCLDGSIKVTRFIQFKRFFRYLDRGEPQWPRRF